MLPVTIRDPSTSRGQSVDPSGASHIVQRLVPPLLGGDAYRIYRAYFTDSAGSSDMLVDGSTTNVEFAIRADDDADRFIHAVSFQIADAASDLSKFGGIAALTNGVLFQYETSETTVVIHEGLKTNGNLVRVCAGMPSFGDGTTAFQFPNIGPPGAPVVGYIPFMDVDQIFGLPIPLRRGTTQKLTLTVRDDISAPDQFDCIAYGYDRLPD